MSSMKVLFVTSEFSGLAKAGGLGEVSAGLPLALRLRGIDVRVLMPAYPDVIAKLPDITWFGRLAGRAAIPGCRIGTAVLPACRWPPPISRVAAAISAGSPTSCTCTTGPAD